MNTLPQPWSATFFFATYDPRTRELWYVNAGHNSPMLLSGISGERRRLEPSGPVVGLLPTVTYEAQSVILKRGDLLIAYTDGIREAMTIEDEEWGDDRMFEAALSSPDALAGEVLEQIFRAADAFTAGAEQGYLGATEQKTRLRIGLDCA
jgi:sigma-B regulation protein RsbU (phosphoserine phosphatase)